MLTLLAMPIAILFTLLVAFAGPGAAAENIFRSMTVEAHTDASARDNIGEMVSSASPGDTITLLFHPPDGYTMESSELTDHTPIGWVMTGRGRYRLVIPATIPLASAHEAEFYGKLKKIPEGGGGETPSDTPKDYFWGVRGKVLLTKAHEGMGHDNLRAPAANTVFAAPDPPSPAKARAPATCDTETEEIKASDGSKEFGEYTGALDTKPQLTGVKLPPNETKKCPQDGTDDVIFAYMGVAPGLTVVLDPDTIVIDTVPDFGEISGILRNTLTARWNDMADKTAKHEDQHRADAYAVAREAAAYLASLRAYGYAPKAPRAEVLAQAAFKEFAEWYVSSMRNRIYDEADALDERTDHGRK